MTEFQATILRAQLKRLPEQTARRAENAEYLRTLLTYIPGLRLPAADPRITCHANHLFPFRYDPTAFGGKDYATFIQALNAEGIPCSSGYVPLYKEKLFARLTARQGSWCQAGRSIDYPNLSLPVCEQVCRDTVWIFQTPLLGMQADMDDIATAIAKIQRAWA